jgi:methionyl-tRNA formyltransferase
MSKKRIVFMGTPEFAVESLRRLVEEGKNIVAVITAPDKPQGRGKKLGQSPVKEYALLKGIKVLQPSNLKDSGFQEELRSLKADLQVVVAFRMLPESVWNMPPDGTFNLHASLLPQYRGAAPINWAIINGENETGVTTFFLKHEIDTGSIIFQEKEIISDSDTVGDLYERLMKKGADLVVRTVNEIEAGTVTGKPQDETAEIKHAPKIFKEDCQLDWSETAQTIHNKVRGLSPYPAAWTRIDGKLLKIYRTRLTSRKSETSPGSISVKDGNIIEVSTADFQLELLELQLEGKKRIQATDFIRGNSRLLENAQLG